MNPTYVTGYWRIKNNKKHNYAHYKELIPLTVEKYKNKNLIFFHDNDKIILDLKKKYKNKNIKFIYIKIKDLPTYEISKEYVESCKNQNNSKFKYLNKEKGYIHYSRDYLNSSPIVYRSLFTIWTSKIFLINNVIDNNIFKSDYFTWIDSGISKLNKKNFYHINKNYYNNKLNYFNSRAYYHGEQIHGLAGFMNANKYIYKKLLILFKNELKLNKNSNYAHDEETLIFLIYKKNNNLFNSIKLF